MTPSLSAVGMGASQGAGERAADGVAIIFDELRAGTRVTFTCGSFGSGGSLSLAGHSVAFSDENKTYSVDVTWNLPHTVIAAGVTYVAWIAGDSVEVSRFV